MAFGIVMVIFSVFFWVFPLYPNYNPAPPSELGIVLGLTIFFAGYAARRLKDRYNL